MKPETEAAGRDSSFLTTRELAYRWRTTARAIHTMRWRGDAPPVVKRGSRLLFSLRDIEAYERSRTSINTSEVSR